MMAAVDVIAVDVAREFVATKVALVQIFENFTGDELPGAMDWAYESPVKTIGVPGDNDADAQAFADVSERANEITEEMGRAIGLFFARRYKVVS